MVGNIIESIRLGSKFGEFHKFKKCVPWLPKRCYLSNKLLWLKPCYRAQWKYGMFLQLPDGDPPYYIWVGERELLMYRLCE